MKRSLQAKNSAESRIGDKWIGPRRISMQDVANAAGVSLITVSRALRQPDIVLAETRRRIDEAVRETGYVPNLAARSLQLNRTGIVAVLLPSLKNSIFADTALGISDVFGASGYQIMVGNLGDQQYREAEERLVSAFLGRRPDGFVLMAADHSDLTRRLLTMSGIPVVETWSTSPDPIDMAVGVSNVEAARAMVLDLARRGCREIGIIMGQYTGNHLSDERLVGYETAMKELGRSLRPELIVRTPVPTTLDSGGIGLKQLMLRAPEADAAFCAGDVFAHGVMLTALAEGIAVPGRIAVAGIGDLELSARLPPGLTTVRINGYDIGERAARMILAKLNGRPPKKRIHDVGFEIIRRGSA